jgi:hypothetical protein
MEFAFPAPARLRIPFLRRQTEYGKNHIPFGDRMIAPVFRSYSEKRNTGYNRVFPSATDYSATDHSAGV